MRKFTKYHKKIKLAYMSSAFFMCVVMAVTFPLVNDTFAADNAYYLVVLDGEELGTVSGKAVIDKAVSNARLRLNEESESIVYLEPDLVIYKQDKLFGNKQSEEQLEEKIYDALVQTADLAKKQAYVINIDGFTVTVGSKEDVVKLLEAAKAKYDTSDEFSVDLVESSTGAFSSITFNVVKADTKAADVNQVRASENSSGEEEAAQTASTEVQDDGILSLSFEENIEIVESYVDTSEIMGLDEAVDQITKDKESNKIYEVQEGDCLSKIASSYDLKVSQLLSMNSGLTEDSLIGIGDEITVTVPEPELSVVVQEEKTYEEDYEADVQYIEDDSMYTGENVVLNEGSLGHRQVTAKITTRNGVETGREILSQTVMSDSVAKVVRIGTKTPPTFVKPLSGGTFSSGFGARWGTVHKGVDWACPVGTAVKASSGGTVITAGWSSSYGYTILIQHSDGKQTRYGHMSKLLVSAGQTVSQNEKIGLSGNTGNSTGPHLHFEILVNGTQVDPLNFLQ